ncbi:MAG: class I tRNA ligase family protein [Patescibacteria group bacterium]
MSEEKPLEKPPKSKVAETEEKILAFWEKNSIFKKTLAQEAPDREYRGDFVFYDGPPFATGEPHYGHVVPGTIKDIIPRYKTMQGYKVRRRWGWDCHGLPVENIIEKELGLASKKDIVDYGVGKFNAMAKGSVMRYADDWRKIIPRLGRWVDMEDDYRTMDATYTESVWWAFSQLHKKGLIYEGFKSMNLCPRCETTLSNFEVSQGYKDITDISVYVKFKLSDAPDTFFLAWTTTPWTLPGNVALAINPEIEYVKIKIFKGVDAQGKTFEESFEANKSFPTELELIKEEYILAKSRLSVLKDTKYKIVETVKGSELVGKSYEPVFDYYSKDKKLKNAENGWKVYGAEFVTTEDGSGIVHIAPAFGADDYELSLKHNLPFVQHVTTSGVFRPEVTDFAGQLVKPKDTLEEKDAHQKADVEIIKYLAKKERLFAKEKLIHSYPHCWRCDTPLLNYASSSWFVKVTALRDKLVNENKKVEWVPAEIGEGRFGNWLLGARDWAISRSRFWGAPLPVWKDDKTGECKVLGSVEDLKKHSKAKNTYYVCRHGEAENNAKMIISSLAENPHHLTDKGKKQAEDAGKWLTSKKIDLIFTSPFVRTRETAEIIAKKIGIDKKKIISEPKICEINTGIWNGKGFNDFISSFGHESRFTETPEGGENYADIKKRVGDFLYSLEKKYEGKNILIVSHDTPLFLLDAAAQGLDREQSIALRGTSDHFNINAKPRKLDFSPLPHNDEYEVELHRPFIDDIELVSEKGNKMTRIPEVFDCWFESGAMPFGEAHYPFSKDDFNPKPGPFSKILGKTKGYPADFIAEGLDQTRGWFYSMIVLGVALFGKSPYKRVVVNGLVLAEDGRKMSKREKNYPDLMLIVNKYGADALRYFLMSSPIVKGQDFAFSEKGVDEVVKKHIGRLNNVVSFYEMYAPADGKLSETKSTHVLDIWIMTRLAELAKEVTDALEKYEIDRAARPFAQFIDDLSTWYLRRSRDRFKGENVADKEMALYTTRNVLIDFAKLIAPLMPFTAEDVYLRLKGPEESVHLESWPSYPKVDESVIANMQKVRTFASLGLEARMKEKINVRQPLTKLAIKATLPTALADLVKDEVNVKEILQNPSLNEEVILDVALTPELKEEGTVRELIRAIQDLRKEKGLTIQDRAILTVDTDAVLADIIEKNKSALSSATGLKDIVLKSIEGESTAIGEFSAKLDIEK